MVLRILHIVTKLELGGAQRNVLDILSGLDQKRFEIHLISSKGLLNDEARAIPHLHLTLLPFLRRPPNPIFDLWAFLVLVSYMKRNKIQIVHTHSSKAGILGRWAARLAGVPVIIHSVHGWGFHDYLKSFLNDFFIFLERVTARITTKLIAVSENDIRKGLDLRIGSQNQYLLIRCGIVARAFKAALATKADTKRSLGLKEDDPAVGMIACLKPQKNPMDFVRSASLILQANPETKFLIVGDGVLRSLISREIQKRRLKDCFFMLGWRKDIEKVMSVFDVFVLTSLWEGLPLVLLEAMSSGKPVVAYDIGGISEVVKDGVNGFLVRPKDIEDLSRKITLLLDNEERRQRMGEFGQHIVSDSVFSSSSMVTRISQLYEKLLVS